MVCNCTVTVLCVLGRRTRNDFQTDADLAFLTAGGCTAGGGGAENWKTLDMDTPKKCCGRKQIVPEKSLFPDRRIAIKYFTDTPAAVNKMHRVFPQSAHVSRTNRTSHILRNKIRLGWSTYPTVPRRSVLTHPALRLQSFLSFLPSLFSRF